jgi:hypothetical protein
MVNNLSKHESDESNNPEVIKKSLDDIVKKLDQDADASKSWSSSVTAHKE